MKQLKTFILFLALSICLFSFALPVPSLAAVNINSYCYNSRSSFAEDITVVNAQYADYTILLPGAIVSKGKGAGLEDIDDSAFSHKIVYVKAYLGNIATISNIGASLETDSATYAWIKNLDERQGDKPLSLAVGYNLSNGTIVTSFWDYPAEITEDLTIVGGNYSGAAVIEPGLILYGGSGIADGNFSQVAKVTSGMRVTIEQGGEGELLQWQLAAITKTEDKWCIRIP